MPTGSLRLRPRTRTRDGGARILGWLGRFQEAEAEFRAVLRVTPRDPDVLGGLAWVLAREQWQPDALALLDQSIAIDSARADLREQRKDYRIEFVPDPVCWTEVPSDLRSLARQCARWQKGLFDVLRQNSDMLFRRPYGRIGAFSLPYQWIFEPFEPVFELLGLSAIVLAAVLGVMNQTLFIPILIYGYAFATLLSIGAVLLEEITFRRYNRVRDMTTLIFFCFLEHFPYRQLHLFWRLEGIWQYLRGDLQWKPLK